MKMKHSSKNRQKPHPFWVLISAVIFFSLSIVLPGAPVVAAENTLQLEQMVVTATRNKKSMDQVTADISIVTEEEINTAPANNVDDVLRRLGGIDIRRPSDFGITSPLNVNIRGVGGSKRVLFMVDGVPTNSPITGFLFPNQVQMSSIRQVEVVKGAFSSLYGSNAMGGVINVITKERDSDGVDITPSVKVGNEGLLETGTALNGRHGALSYSFNAGYREIDNHYLRDEDVKYSFNRMTGAFNKSYVNVSDHSDYDDQRFFGKLSYDVSDVTRLTLSANYVQSDTEMGNTTFLAEPRPKETEHTYHFINLNARTRVACNIDLDVRAYTNYDKTDSNTEHITRNPDAGTGGSMPGGMGSAMPGSGMGDMGESPFSYLYGTRVHRGQDIGLQVKAGRDIGANNYLTAGFDASFIDGYWKNKAEDGALIGDKMDDTLNNQAFYLQNETDLFSALMVTVGMRYDINSESDNSFSPKIGVRYRLNDRISFQSSAGRAFRAPNLNELYTPTWMMVPGVPFESNADLDPEIIWSYDLGTTLRLTDRIKFNLTGFYSKAEDLISNPITNGVMRYENLDEVETDGFETGIEGTVLPWLDLYLNYTYTHSVDKDAGRLDNQALHQANSGLRASFTVASQAVVTTTFDLRYNGEMAFTDRMSGSVIELEEWVVVDLGVHVRLFRRWVIQGAITNLFGEDYEIHGTNLGPDRACWMAVQCTF